MVSNTVLFSFQLITVISITLDDKVHNDHAVVRDDVGHVLVVHDVHGVQQTLAGVDVVYPGVESARERRGNWPVDGCRSGRGI